ncbi:MAG TPA: AAA family ATPase [Trebonia sp.]
MTGVSVVVLCGPPGVGKSSLAEEMFDQLSVHDVRHAVIDVDALCLCWPFRPGDRYNTQTAVENLAAVWAGYRRQGISRLILARVVESEADIARLLSAVPGADHATVCQLTARPETIEERIRRREVGSSAEPLVARSREIAVTAPEADFADIVLDTEATPLSELAADLLKRLGWLG